MSENYPVEVLTYVYAPGLNPYVFYIELAGEPLGALGAIEQEIARVFAEHRAPLLIFKVLRSDGLAKLLVVFADVEGDAVAERLASALGRIPRVIRATYSRPAVRGFAYCERCFPPTVGGERAVIFPRVVYEGFIREGWRKYGTSFPLLLYPLGFEAGRYAYRRCLEVAGGDARAAVRVMEAFFQLLGLGRLEFLRVDDRGMEAAYRVYDSFECELFRDAGEIKSSFVRGIAGGFLAERWGVSDPDEVVVREEKCVAKGDPYCEARVWVERKKQSPPGMVSSRAGTRREDTLEEGVATGQA